LEYPYVVLLEFRGDESIWPLFVRKKLNLAHCVVLNTTLLIKKRHPSVTGASKHDFFNGLSQNEYPQMTFFTTEAQPPASPSCKLWLYELEAIGHSTYAPVGERGDWFLLV
jgi:hypothetical protein